MSYLAKNTLPTPTLMRLARGTYAQAIRSELHALGHNDLPRNGVIVLTAIEDFGGTKPELTSELGVTKQAVSLIVDTLVNRGYLERRPDINDRRRVDLQLTGRGREVVEAAARAVDAIDGQLEERVSREQIEAARAVLIALSEIKMSAVAEGTGVRRALRELRSFSPIFKVRDVGEALLHYRSLGFDTFTHDYGDEYGFANRDGVSLHLTAATEHDEPTMRSAYLYVRDADALYEEWSRPGIAGHTHRVETTSFQFREGSHVDPDGNQIRFGSPIEE